MAKAELYSFKSDAKKEDCYLDKVSELLKTIDDLETELHYKYFISFRLAREGKYDRSIELCNEIIERSGDKYIKIKGNTYATIAYIYIALNKFKEAIDLNQKSVDLLNSIGYARGVVRAFNNMGTTYYDNYQDIDKALEYYIKAKNLSKEYRLLSGELTSLMNIGIVFHNKYDYLLAYKHFVDALKKALQNNYKDATIFLYDSLSNVSLEMNNYSEAFDYYNLSIEEAMDDPYFMEAINLTSISLYYTFGKFDKALEYSKKTLEYLKDITSGTKYIYSIKYYWIKLLIESPINYNSYVDKIIGYSKNLQIEEDKIIYLSKVIITLHNKKDWKNAKKVFSEIERSLNENMHDEVKSFYFHAKGVIQFGQQSLNTLEKALRLAKSRNNKLHLANIKIKIGNYYYFEKDYHSALNFYINGAETIRSIIYDIPDEFKLDFVNNHCYLEVFYRIRLLKQILLKGKKDKNEVRLLEDKIQIDCLKQLVMLLEDDYNNITGNKEFMNKLVENHMYNYDNNILDENSIIANLDGDIVKDMELIIRNLGAVTLSTKGLIILEEENNDLVVIASINEENTLPLNRSIFDKIKSSMNPIIISNGNILSEYESTLLNKDSSACMYIPIANGYTKFLADQHNKSNKNNRPKILGYLYLETDNTLNNFNEETFKKHINLINLIALLCDKYILRKISTIDKLTGALTRKSMEDMISDLIKLPNKSDEEFSIIMYDLDRFKRVNDKFGHQKGDEVLKTVSKLVMDNIDKKADLGRYGGEEFVIILPSVDTVQALNIANGIREKVYNQKILGDKMKVSISLGVATYPIHGNTVASLIYKADQALYSSKENGRNRAELWNENIVNKVKPLSKLDGIITGDEVQDARNTLAIVETIQLISSNISKKDKIYIYLGRIMETLKADYGYLFLIENELITEKYGRRFQEEKWIDIFNYNEEMVRKVIKKKESLFTIDWEDVSQKDLIIGLPIWNSILVVPLIHKNELKGLIYLVVSTKSKEFGINDLNFANIFSNLLQL